MVPRSPRCALLVDGGLAADVALLQLSTLAAVQRGQVIRERFPFGMYVWFAHLLDHSVLHLDDLFRVALIFGLGPCHGVREG